MGELRLGLARHLRRRGAKRSTSARGERYPVPRGRRPSSRCRRAASRGATVPWAGEVGRTAGLELQQRSCRRFEEPAVVRDEDDGGVDRLECLLEPLDVVDVEGFVGSSSRRGSDRRRAHARARPASGRHREGLERPVEVTVPEAETAKRGVHRSATRTRPHARDAPALRSSGAASRIVFAGRHRLLEPRQLLLGRDQVACAESAYSRNERPRSSGGR